MKMFCWRVLMMAAALVVVVAVIISGIWLTCTVFTSRYPGGNDFYARWVGGCALFREGMNPYSRTVTLRIQRGMYGRPARADEDQVAFAYPLYSLIFFWPLCLTNNYPLVQAIWLWVLLAALIVSVILWLRLIRWHPHLWLWSLTIVWSVLLYHNLRALLLGQFAVWVLLTLVAALWTMERGFDGWGGIFLAFSTVKPQMVYLATPWILLWAAGKGRWRVWLGFFLAFVGLVLFPMVLLPFWIPDFVSQAILYPSYTVYGSLTWMIVQYALGLGFWAEILVIILLLAGLLILGWRLWRGDWEQMLWMLGVLLLATNFFTPRIATTNYLLFMPWVLWGFKMFQRAWGRRGTWAIVVFELLSLFGLWGLFLVTVEGDFETAPVYFPFPTMMGGLLFWLWRYVQPDDGGEESERV